MEIERERRRNRIREIAFQLVASQVARGALDPDDPIALRAAAKEAAETAKAAYDAAMDFVFK